MDRVAGSIDTEPEAETTVGPLGHPMIHAWAGAADVSEPLALVTSALGVRTGTQAVLFRGVLDALAHLAPILRSWDLNGSQTYGTAKLAGAWQRRPPNFDVLLPPKVDAGASSDTDFDTDIAESLLSTRHDALFLLFGRPYPHGLAKAVHQRLRAWAFLHGLRIFTLTPNPDKLLSRVSRSLANAALETEFTAWRDLLATLGAPADRWEQINGRFIALGDDKEHETLPRHRNFLAASYKLAKLEHDPYVGTFISPSGFGTATAWAQRVKSAPSDGGLDAEEFEPAAKAMPRLRRAADTADDIAEDIDSFETDPGQTTDEQARAIEIIRFQLGAAARFLPWDWPNVIPPERDALSTLISRGLDAPAHAAELRLAAIMSVAVAAGLNLEEAAAVPLQTAPGDGFEWWLDLTSGSLVRRPPRHATHWKPTPKTAALVYSAVQELRFPIAEDAIREIKAAKQARPSANLLGQLWFDSATSLGRAFRDWVKQGRDTSRIHPSMFAKLLGQTAFERCNDAVLARLLSSNRVSPMPSSTVYTAYGLDQLETAMPGTTANPTARADVPVNVAGSLLESAGNDLLESSFAELLDEIDRHRRTGDVNRFHNSTVLYWDAVLRAATGVRPVNGLWTSLALFDWENSAVYIEDKASPVAHTGRIVPLPAKLCTDFKGMYVERHFPWIVGQLGATFGVEASSIPALLFLVEENSGPPDLVAIENRHRKTKDGNYIEGRLPLNLLRHRLRTLLHRETDADLEVVDTVLGHGDGAGSLTHGDFSMRVWRTDAEAIRPALTRIFDSLFIKTPALWPGCDAVPVSQFIPGLDRVIDMPAMKEDTSAAHKAVADSIIRQFLSAAGSVAADEAESLPALVASLTEDQLDDLSCRLLTDEQGMPSSTGAPRYDRLLELAGTAWDQLGLRAPFRRRYSPRDIELSQFTPLAAQAGALTGVLRQRLDAMFDTAGERSRIKLKHALVLAIFDLVLTSRITHLTLLQSIIDNDRQWRIVRFEDDFFLEWSPSDDLERKKKAPVQRFAISLRSAWLLNQAVRGKTRRKAAWALSQTHSLPLVSACASVFGAKRVANLDELLRAVLSAVDQANVLELPGSVAGFLAGRVWTASLGWADWIRLRTGRWVDTESTDDDDSNPEEATDENKLRVHQLPDDEGSDFATVAETRFQDADEIRPRREKQSVSLQDAAFALIQRVQTQLGKLRGSEDGSKHRARAAESLSREIRASAASVSSAVQLLCLWSIDMLIRPGRSRKLATGSVLRYMGALSKRFKAMAYAVELETMADVEIEAFYSSVLAGATVAKLEDIYEALRNFHTFSQVACGLPDIDWSLLTASRQVRLGSPGFVDESSYLHLLASLSHEHSPKGFANWQLQCIALMAFRFGLRGGEATGLRRSDLHLDGPTPYLIVRNNRDRDLKTRASRRVVPLLFDLTPVELSAIQKLTDFHAFDGIGLEDAPAFATVEDPGKALDGYKMCAVINGHLKAITGQASSTLHKLRKAFLIRVWRAVEAPGYEAACLPRETQAARERIRLTLLGTREDIVSRRGATAVSRVAGHSHISSTLRSYVHVLSDVAQSSAAISRLPACLGLSPELVDAPPLDKLFPEVTPAAQFTDFKMPTPKPVDALRALMFLSRGRSASEAAEFSNISISRVEELQATASLTYDRFLGDAPGVLRRHVEDPQSSRLARQGILSLLHINAHARLRDGLTTMPPSLIERLSEIKAITAPHWEAIVGGRREISMWEPNHFLLTAIAARHFLEPGTRLKLMAPNSMTNVKSRERLTKMAIHAGWLSEGEGAQGIDSEGAPLCQSLDVVGGLPRVRISDQGVTVDSRLVMRLTGAVASDRICDGFELAVALLCLNALTAAATT